MILYIDRSEVPDVENISPDVLRYVVQKAQTANIRYDLLNRYYRGEHPVLTGGKANDVKVAVNYAKYVVDIILGYYLGETVKYDANDRSDGSEPKAAGDVEAAAARPNGQFLHGRRAGSYDPLGRASRKSSASEGDAIDLAPLQDYDSRGSLSRSSLYAAHRGIAIRRAAVLRRAADRQGGQPHREADGHLRGLSGAVLCQLGRGAQPQERLHRPPQRRAGV